MMYSALIWILARFHSSVPVREHLVDRGVENGDVSLHVNGILSRSTLKSIQPALAVGIGFSQGDVLPEAGPSPMKRPEPAAKTLVTAFSPSIDPMSSPTSTVAPGAALSSNSTISPNMRVANFVRPTRQTPGDSSSSQ